MYYARGEGQYFSIVDYLDQIPLLYLIGRIAKQLDLINHGKIVLSAIYNIR